jgi:hypothetical protein
MNLTQHRPGMQHSSLTELAISQRAPTPRDYDNVRGDWLGSGFRGGLVPQWPFLAPNGSSAMFAMSPLFGDKRKDTDVVRRPLLTLHPTSGTVVTVASVAAIQDVASEGQRQRYDLVSESVNVCLRKSNQEVTL